MANTTFTGPVTSLNGFIGGANVNAADTQQGGTVAWTVTNATTLTIATGIKAGENLLATANEGVMVYTGDGGSGNAVYAFSDGSDWLRCDTRVAVANS
jgi:hypothetical protein|tara:strand:- start:1514 stop:1807 length:294 start_codon:yes stop_codon:yes gene_type:complete